MTESSGQEALGLCPNCGKSIDDVAFRIPDHRSLKCKNCGYKLNSQTIDMDKNPVNDDFDLRMLDPYKSKKTGEKYLAVKVTADHAKRIAEETKLFEVIDGLIYMGPFNVADFGQWLVVKTGKSENSVKEVFTVPRKTFRALYEYAN